MDRQVPWLVFGLVVVLVVTVGSIGLALVLPDAVGDTGRSVVSERDQAGWPFAWGWGRERAVDPGGALAPLWLLLLVAVPLSLLGLAVVGLVWAHRAVPSATAGLQPRCRGCGQGIEPGWRFCPYCGEQGENARDQ